MSAVLPAVSRGIARTLVDGTLRITIEIEPTHAVAAMMLLGMPGQPIAVAALAPQNTDLTPPAPTAAEPVKPAGGPLAKSAALVGATVEFRSFVAVCLDLRRGPVSESEAADHIREVCCIASRRDLDHDPQARTAFALMMANFRKWQEAF